MALRTGSFNRHLAEQAARQFEEQGAIVTRLDLRDYALLIYDGDLEARSGVPSVAPALHEQFRTHQGIFLASPEYNTTCRHCCSTLLHGFRA